MIYLAHPFPARHIMRDWEMDMEQKYKIDLLNPFYDQPRSDISRIDAGEIKASQLSPSEIVEMDTQAILKSEAVLALVGEYQSHGTIMEMVYARFFCVPVYLVCESSAFDHPWLVHHSKWRGRTLEDAERWLVNCFCKSL